MSSGHQAKKIWTENLQQLDGEEIDQGHTSASDPSGTTSGHYSTELGMRKKFASSADPDSASRAENEQV